VSWNSWGLFTHFYLLFFLGGGCFLWQSKLREPEMEAELADWKSSKFTHRKTAGASIMFSHTKLHHDSNSGSQTSHLSHVYQPLVFHQTVENLWKHRDFMGFHHFKSSFNHLNPVRLECIHRYPSLPPSLYGLPRSERTSSANVCKFGGAAPWGQQGLWAANGREYLENQTKMTGGDGSKPCTPGEHQNSW